MQVQTALFTALLATLSLACGRRVTVTSLGTPVWYEDEPNNLVEDANYFGHLRAGDAIFIDGSISDPCCDPFDGFAFVSSGPLLVEFYLEIDNPYADLDVCIYDAYEDDITLCFERDGTLYEEGIFEVVYDASEFHFVVSTYDFPSDYRLEIYTYPLYAATPAPEQPLALEALTSPLRSRAPEALTSSKAPSRHGAYLGADEEPAADPVTDEIVTAVGTAVVELSDGTLVERSFAITESGRRLPFDRP